MKLSYTNLTLETVNILIVEFDVIDNLKDMIRDIFADNPTLPYALNTYDYNENELPHYIITYRKDYTINLSALERWKETIKSWKEQDENNYTN